MINITGTTQKKTFVKVCGIRSEMAAKTAIFSGAKFIGFNFVSGSRRKISPEVAKQIIDTVRNQVKTVGVFQNHPAEFVNRTAEEVGLDLVQLHGEETFEYIKEINFPVIKALNLESDFDLTQTLKLINNFEVEYILLDREKQGKGKMLNLKHVSIICKEKSNVFVAGGLTPENVLEVVRATKPFGVDVASGIETRSIEDLEKIKLFCERVKNA